VGGLPTAAVTDLASTPNTKIKILDIAHFTEKMNAKYGPLYAPATIPKSTYKGMEADAKNNTVWNIMAVNASMDEKLAYDLTRIMLEKRDDLALVHGRRSTSSWSGRLQPRRHPLAPRRASTSRRRASRSSEAQSTRHPGRSDASQRRAALGADLGRFDTSRRSRIVSAAPRLPG
jgi:hypothetical protein